jgi:hypothetical protein
MVRRTIAPADWQLFQELRREGLREYLQRQNE